MAADLLDRLRRAVDVARPASSDHDLNPGTEPVGAALRPAGVLIAVDTSAGAPRVWLTMRSSRLKHHPGQIALPGGKVDPGDDGPIAAALREAEEEIGLPREGVEVWGALAPHRTVTSFAVTPVVGRVAAPFSVRPEAGEVDEAFSVPLSVLIELGSYRVESRRWRGGRRYYYVVPYGPYYIWGATARILRGLAARMADAP